MMKSMRNFVFDLVLTNEIENKDKNKSDQVIGWNVKISKF